MLGGRVADQDTGAREAGEAVLFARYAEEDLDRWRGLIGGEAVHSDARWCTGCIVDVRWGTVGGYTASYLQVRVRYAKHGSAVFSAASFAAHHRLATVSVEVRRVIRDCFEADRSEAERTEILERHTRELREARNREMLDRSEALKRRAIGRRASVA